MNATTRRTKWPGTPEQRLERRSLLLGRAVWPTLDDEKRTGWIDAAREVTPPRDRHIWAQRYLADRSELLETVRGQHWGRCMLARWARGEQLEWWPVLVPLAEELDEWVEAWLWCAECLTDDGWHQVDIQDRDGRPAKAWTQAPTRRR